MVSTTDPSKNYSIIEFLTYYKAREIKRVSTFIYVVRYTSVIVTLVFTLM